jgi:hypothetical protein
MIGDLMISQKLEKKLVAAGWYQMRRVSTTDWVAGLLEDGFDVIPEAEKIIANFGGITLKEVPEECTVYQPPVVFFDPTTPGGGGDVDRVPDWERRLGIIINPIGELSGGHATLLYGNDGRIFSALDGLLYLYGESFEDALENTLLFGRRIPQKIGNLTDGEI